MRAKPILKADRRVGIGDADVHVQPERRLAAGQLPHRFIDERISSPARDLGLRPVRERMRSRAGREEVVPGELQGEPLA